MSNKLHYKPYIAIIGDIKQSRKIEDRKMVQEKLKEVLDKINKQYEKTITAKFIITLGDEFQGLLNQGINVIDIIEQIQKEMHPIQIRFGIGIGKITTEINSDMAIGADGPGFYKAREAIEILKNDEQRNAVRPSDIRIEIDEDNTSVSSLLNAVFSLMEVIKSSWSERQREIISEYEKYDESQTECAKRLNITQSSVQRSLTKGNFYSYKSAKETVVSVLQEIGEIYV